MSSNKKHLYLFGDYGLDVSNQVLLKNDEPVLITPKTLRLLQVLVENYGQIVEKETLMCEVWADRFVEESNITYNIRKLRKLLDDNIHNPAYIKTVHTRGYCFIAKTEELWIENGLSVMPSRSLNQSGKQSSNSILSPYFSKTVLKFLIFPAIIFVGSWLIFTLWFLTSKINPVTAASILSAPRKMQALSDTGNVFNAIISPDGKQAVYVNKNQGKQSIWLRDLVSSVNQPLLPDSDEDYFGLTFSHKGDALYFVKRPRGASQTNADIYRMSLSGRILVKIINNAQGWISLSPDDTKIAFDRNEIDEQKHNALLIADIDGQNEKIAAVRNNHDRFRANRWSPDGKKIACAVGQSENGANEVSLNEIEVETGVEKEITPHKFFYIADLEWLPDQTGLILTAKENLADNNQFWQVSTIDGNTVPLFSDAANYSNISLAKDASQMITTQVISDFQLSISDVSGIFVQTKSTISTIIPLTTCFTSDGRIVYSAKTNGQADIWIMNPDGSEQKQLTNNQFADFNPLPSTDEKYIFFTSNRSGSNQIWRMNFDGSDQIQITQKEGGSPIFVSPDGKLLFYQSALNKNLWKVSTDGGEETPFLETCMINPAFSADGKFLAYFYRDKDKNAFKLVIISTDNLQPVYSFRQVIESAFPIQTVWSKDGKAIFYASENNSNTILWKQSPDNRLPQKIKFLGSDEVAGFSLSPDNKSLAVVSGNWKHDAILIKGFK